MVAIYREYHAIGSFSKNAINQHNLTTWRQKTCDVIATHAEVMCIRLLETYAAVADIKNNAWVTANNNFWVDLSQWGDLPKIFTSDEVTSENHWQIASRVTQKSLFTVTNLLFYFLHAILCPEHTILLKTIIDRSFRNCRQGRSFLTQHCDVTIVDLWRHANARY